MAAIFTFPHFPSLSFSPNSTLRCISPSRSHFSCSSVRAQLAPSEGEREKKRGLAVLWFKHDLRIDDHPGLVAASDHPALVPLYIFDHRLLCRKSHIHTHSLCLSLYSNSKEVTMFSAQTCRIFRGKARNGAFSLGRFEEFVEKPGL